MREPDINQGAATEINSQWDAMPERHGKNSRYAEDQRKGDEIPLLAKKIYVRITKKFHAALTLSVVTLPSFVLRRSRSHFRNRSSLRRTNDQRPTTNDQRRF